MLDEHSRLILNSHDWHAINLVCAWARLISGVNRSFNSGLAKNLPGLQIRSYRPMRSNRSYQAILCSHKISGATISKGREDSHTFRRPKWGGVWVTQGRDDPAY
jgi:hypothetical protein